MSLSGLRENMKLCEIKSLSCKTFVESKTFYVRKIIQFSEAEVTTSFDCDKHLFERFTGRVRDWSILNNNWSIQV